MTFKAACFAVAAPILACQLGCVAFVQTSHGVQLQNASNVRDIKSGCWKFPSAHNNGGEVWIKDPPVVISLSHRPQNEVLSVGPDAGLLPLPIIPWPPGIAGRLFSDRQDNSEDDVEVILTFARLWWYPVPPDKDLTLDPKDVVLKVGSEEFTPSSSFYRAHQFELIHYGSGTYGGYMLSESVPDPYASEYGLRDGVFHIRVSAEYDRKTEIHLTFPVKYKDLRSGTLEIRRIQTPSGDKSLSGTLLENGRRRLSLSRCVFNT